MSFRNIVQKSGNGGISPPNKPSFKMEDWVKGFEEITSTTDDDAMLFHSGIVFFGIFENIRNRLKELNNQIPRLSNENIVKLHLAESNLNYKKIDAKLKTTPPKVLNFLVPQDFKLFGGDFDIAPQDVVDAIVDSIHYAVSVRVNDLSKKNSSKEALEVEVFIRINSLLSQIYYLFEEYWQGILWGNYELIVTDREIKIKQIYSKENIGYLVSLARKMKIETGNSVFNRSQSYDDVRILCYRNKKIVIRDLSSLSKIEVDTYYSLVHTGLRFRKNFPNKLIEGEIKDLGFNISNVIEVFIKLVIFSRDIFNRLNPSDNLLDLCPVFSLSDIARRMADIVNLRYDKVVNILNFLSFKGKKDNLWSQPVILLQKRKLTILFSSIVAPNMPRIIEYWIKKAFENDEVAKKGVTYESKVVNSVNSMLEINSVFSDYDKAVNKKYKVGDEDEEIDCIFRFGKIVVICEVKSIITVDSEISKFNTLKNLKKASQQAQRKAKFVKNNLQEVFNISDWEFDGDLEYEIIPVIINSNRIYCGVTIDDTPVVDEMLISAFFGSNKVPLLSVDAKKHIAWFEIYNSFEDAQDKFKLYLENPPQIALDSRYIEYNSSYPFKGALDIGLEIELEVLSIKTYDLSTVIEAEYLFPVVKSQDYDEIVSRLNILI